MKIIVAPNQSLRVKSDDVQILDKKILALIKDLEKTLKEKNNPKGVGLAAPQINKNLRIFVTQLPKGNEFTNCTSNISDDNNSDCNMGSNKKNNDSKNKSSDACLKHFINPNIIKHASKLIFGETEQDKEPVLEGCLSIPKIYAPVPRWSWIELEYQVIENDKLVKKRERFANFTARVIQHETDHLNGILFTDYALDYDLPIYFENEKTGKLEETANKEILKSL